MANLLKLSAQELITMLGASRSKDHKVRLGTVMGQEHVLACPEDKPNILMVNVSTIDQVINALAGGVNNSVTIHPGELFMSASYRHIDFMFMAEPQNAWAEPYRAYDNLRGRRLREPRALYELTGNLASNDFIVEEKKETAAK
jgi:hypothetical protein